MAGGTYTCWRGVSIPVNSRISLGSKTSTPSYPTLQYAKGENALSKQLNCLRNGFMLCIKSIASIYIDILRLLSGEIANHIIDRLISFVHQDGFRFCLITCIGFEFRLSDFRSTHYFRRYILLLLDICYRWKGAEADGGKRIENDRVNSWILSLLSYKSALCGRDKAWKFCRFPMRLTAWAGQHTDFRHLFS